MPVTIEAKAKAYQLLKEMGVEWSGQRTNIIGRVSEQLNKDEALDWPQAEERAQQTARQWLNIILAGMLVHSLVADTHAKRLVDVVVLNGRRPGKTSLQSIAQRLPWGWQGSDDEQRIGRIPRA